MDVYTFFENYDNEVSNIYRDELIGLWAKSWSDNGWQPTIIGRSIAQRHQRYTQLYDKVSMMPTVNDKQFEIDCYLRWAAMSVIGGGLMVDIDTINIGTPPPPILPQGLVSWGVTRSPYCISGDSSAAFEKAIDWFFEWDGEPIMYWQGRAHVSDMVIIRAHELKCLSLCVDYDRHLCEDIKIVHVHTGAALKLDPTNVGRTKVNLVLDMLQNHNQ